MRRNIWIVPLLAILLSACAAATPASPAEPDAPAASIVAPEPQPSEPAPEAPQPAAPAETPAAPQSAPAEQPAAAPQSGSVDGLAIALQEAGVQAADIRAPKVTDDMEDGTAVLEVEFYVPSQYTEYEFEIDAKTGAVRSQSSEIKGVSLLGEGAAEKLDATMAKVLEKVPGATEQDVALYLDMDDGVPQFEGVVRYDGTEYEFEIDFQTGDILEWESEKY